jgi:hypothetical protein
MTDKQITAMAQEAPDSAVVMAMIDYWLIWSSAIRRARL